MTKEAVDENPTESRRPALRKLTNDLREMQEELRQGFASRRALLDWEQRLSVRTLGALPQRWFHEIGRQFRGELDDGRERTLLAALLRDDVRHRSLSPTSARDLRDRLAALTIRPAYHRAFRELRNDAGEYFDEKTATTSSHDPNLQRYVAMRPAIDELEAYQRRTLDELLDGFDGREAILDWGDDLELATHGEISESFVSRCYREESTAKLLQRTDEPGQRARELFAAIYLVPAFNRGVRDLAGRAGEQPDAEHQETEVVHA